MVFNGSGSLVLTAEVSEGGSRVQTCTPCRDSARCNKLDSDENVLPKETQKFVKLKRWNSRQWPCSYLTLTRLS